MTSDTPIPGPGDETPTRDLLPEAERLLRALNIRTLDPTTIPSPADAYTYLGDWDSLIAKQPQGLTQLGAALAEHARTRTLGTDTTTSTKPATLVAAATHEIEIASGHLEDAADSIRLALKALRRAHAATSALTVEEGEESAVSRYITGSPDR